MAGHLAKTASKSRSLHVGDHVAWQSEAGHVSGHIRAVHTEPFQVNGYTHHASSNDPQYEIASDKTDHVAYHKASALHRLSKGDESLAIALEAKAKAHGKTWAVGTEVLYNYRGAHNKHGKIAGIATEGSDHDHTVYSIIPHQHFEGEPARIHRKGANLRRAG